jgi:hypothetical protein
LRLLLIHLACGCSLAETAVRARLTGLGRVSAVALFKRLRASEEWLRWLAAQERARRTGALPAWGRRVRVVDATAIAEPGSTGTDWRVHYALNLADLQCDFFQLTDAQGGETWRRVPVRAGDLLLGDRAYANPPGVAHVVAAGGDVVVRLNRGALPLFARDGERFPLLRRARGLRVGEIGEWATEVRPASGRRVAGRLLVVKRSRAAARQARQALTQGASRKQRPVSAHAWKAAPYFFLWTSLPGSWPAREVLELYRRRWQIELAFKRMKSLMGLGHLPKKDPPSARAWLHGKLFVALLVERLLEATKAFSPWGYALAVPAQPLA